MRTAVTQTQQVPICQPSPEKKMGSEFTKQLYLPRMQQYDVLFCFSLSLQPVPTHMSLHLLFLKPMSDTQCHFPLCRQHISFHECFYLLHLLLILDLRCLTLCVCVPFHPLNVSIRCASAHTSSCVSAFSLPPFHLDNQYFHLLFSSPCLNTCVACSPCGSQVSPPTVPHFVVTHLLKDIWFLPDFDNC